MNYYPVTVVDNFYENPDEVRRFALAQDYKSCHEIKKSATPSQALEPKT